MTTPSTSSGLTSEQGFNTTAYVLPQQMADRTVRVTAVDGNDGNEDMPAISVCFCHNHDLEQRGEQMLKEELIAKSEKNNPVLHSKTPRTERST